MSGHSKWSKIKHQKGTTDAIKGKVFTKMSKAILIAVKEGGGNTDPNFNFKLRLAIDKARHVNMPKENIERAIEKAKGSGSGVVFQEALYEGFGPMGVGLLIKTATDNKQRTVAEIKNVLERNGGSLATSGAVSHFFTFVGLIQVEKRDMTFDHIFEIALTVGAQDLEDEGDQVAIYTDHTDVHTIKEKLTEKGLAVLNAELYYRPSIQIDVNEKTVANRLIHLLDVIEELDDVQKVYSNANVSDEALS
jgi:YebC/PmpR family DNA-binding regulatory protein